MYHHYQLLPLDAVPKSQLDLSGRQDFCSEKKNEHLEIPANAFKCWLKTRKFSKTLIFCNILVYILKNILPCNDFHNIHKKKESSLESEAIETDLEFTARFCFK